MLFNNTNMRTAMAYTNAVGDKVYPVIVDIKKGIKSTEEILFVSSDINTGILSVAFIQGNDTYNVAGAEVVCSVMRPDASTLDIPCDIVRDNVVEVPLGINGTSQDGIYSFDFKVFKGGNKVVGTPIMNYSVSLSISNDSVVLEDDRLPVLTMLMTQVSELHDRTDEAVIKANTATEASKEATANAIEATNNANAVSERVSQETATAISEIKQDTANAIASMNQSTSTAISTMNQTTNDAIDSMNQNTTNAIASMTQKTDEALANMNQSTTDAISSMTQKTDEAVTMVNNNLANINNVVTTKVAELDTAKSDMTNTVTNKVNEVETRFNALTSKQQQDAEVIDARDGEISLKARLDRDIEKAKQVYVNVEGSNISTDSSVGYAKDVEILGNTVQDASNLADIRSVGDKIEGQELYEIPVLCSGKNLFSLSEEEKSNVGGIYKLPIKNGINYKFSSLDNAKYDLMKYKGDSHIGWYVSDNYNNSVDIKLDENHDNVRIRFKVDASFKRFQLEEGTVATPYEPYVEDKLTILSPTPLEKVGNVADRIICKDGVWGVEKNVGTVMFDGTIVHGDVSSKFPSDNSSMFYIVFNDVINESVVICNKFPNKNIANASNRNIEGVFVSVNGSNNAFYFRIFNDKLSTQNVAGFKQWLSENNVTIKYKTINPQFIPLPHDQQVKLRTFANKTNISFLTEIEGTIKAQVPKSLGATVNTHTEQINNLNKELDRVKKLEESTVSTVTTEGDFTTVEATSNGYFEDVKLEGKTLVNITNKVVTNGNVNNQYASIGVSKLIKPNTVYTYVIQNLGEETFRAYLNSYTFPYKYLSVKVNEILIGKCVSIDNPQLNGIWLSLDTAQTLPQNISLMLLEGDHTQNPPSYFEGLKSVGQSASEDGADEIVVSSVKGDGNLFDVDKIVSNYPKYFKCNDYIKYQNGADATYLKQDFEPNTQYSFTIKAGSNKSTNIDFSCQYTDGTNDRFTITNVTANSIYTKTFTSNANKSIKCFKSFYSDGSIITVYLDGTCINKGTTPKSYTPHQSDKKRLLYYNEETQAWEKPILREWDSIEKHSDGKYYYHQRSGEVVLNGSENWTLHSINSNNIANFFLDNIHHKTDIVPIADKLKPQTSSIAETVDEGILFAGGISVYIRKYISNCGDLQSFKQWLQANNVTVVYQLAEEKVYECTNIDLITYANETNYIVESGAIVPRSTLKVHNNISNVVKILQEKVSLLENKFIQGLKQVLAGDMYSLAELLYPEDFVAENPENNIMLLPFE